MEAILSDLSVSMTEFKKNPNDALRESNGQTVAVLSHNKPAFYMVPPERYEAMLEQLDDLQLVKLAKERLKQKGRAVEVTLDDL
ncbi:MAG: type II toxin-antitoxin system prevent-host-death family antitoxin [Nitrosomonadales bacterium]|nr:type II toxin-antitoxin system prevent-host-death family antitoxin [Nitrosomonadales bacterium]